MALNRAIAVGELHGSVAGLAALDAVDAAPLNGYQPYYAALADLLYALDAATKPLSPMTMRWPSPLMRRSSDFLKRQRRAVTDP